jgi:hypothetical protein
MLCLASDYASQAGTPNKGAVLPWLNKTMQESSTSTATPTPAQSVQSSQAEQNSTGATPPWLKQKQEQAQGGSNHSQVAGSYSTNVTKPVRNFKAIPNFLNEHIKYTEQDFQFIEKEIAKELAQFRWDYDYDIEAVDPDYLYKSRRYLLEIAVLPKPATAAPVFYFDVQYHKDQKKVVLVGKLPPKINAPVISIEYLIKKLDGGPDADAESGRAVKKNVILDTYEYNIADEMSNRIIQAYPHHVAQNRAKEENLLVALMDEYDEENYWYYRGDAGGINSKAQAFRLVQKIDYIDQLRYFGFDSVQIKNTEARILGMLKQKHPYMFETILGKFHDYMEKREGETHLRITIDPIYVYKDGENFVNTPAGDYCQYNLIINTRTTGNEIDFSLQRIPDGDSGVISSQVQTPPSQQPTGPQQSSGYGSPLTYLQGIIRTERITAQTLRSNGITKNEADYLRNFIYATHGYIFKTDKWKNVFTREPWYNPNRYFSESDLSVVERHNVNVLKDYR